MSYAQEGDTGDSGHVILIRKGRFWRLDPFKDGQLLSSHDLERWGAQFVVSIFVRANSLYRQITHVLENTTHEYPAIGTLTASNRDIWAKVSILKVRYSPFSISLGL